MGDLPWIRRNHFTFPLKALQLHTTVLGTSGSGKTETIFRICYGARKAYNRQVIYLDAKGDSKREEEQAEDNAARFVATMTMAGAQNIKVFPALYLNGWLGDVTALKNRLLSVVDLSESAYYGDVAANAVDLALSAPTTPRSSSHFLANLQLERLKAIYRNDRRQYQRVLNLDKDLLQQVEMRYQVFFRAMRGELDGTLDYTDADAVYLRVRGFTLRNEAPRLGRFLVSDFMHYIAERRRPETRTLFVIDEFGALRMREDTSILFEQVRSFGGSLLIAAQGYSALGPPEYAKRILDSCSTYVLHACSDPLPIIERAGKSLQLDTSYSEDEEGLPRKHIRPKWDWKVPVEAVQQQEVGQAFWIYRGHTQQTQTAQVPLQEHQIRDAWQEIRQQEEIQRSLLEVEAGHQEPEYTTASPGEASTPKKQTVRATPKKKKEKEAFTSPTTKAKSAPITLPEEGEETSLNFPRDLIDDDEPDRL
jgi:Type IV secretion-system coupling protein DNA-binding domain